MTKTKDESQQEPKIFNKLPPQGFSKFGKGPQFGVQKIQVRGQFTPPAIRITQNKGGGGK